MYQPVNKIDMEQLQKWKTGIKEDMSEIYAYFDNILDQVLTMDVIKANANLKEGKMKIPLVARIPHGKNYHSIRQSLKIPNQKIFNRIGYNECNWEHGTYPVYSFTSHFLLFDILKCFDKPYLKIKEKLSSMSDNELENLVKNYQPKLPDEMTSEFRHNKYCHNEDPSYIHSVYEIIVKW